MTLTAYYVITYKRDEQLALENMRRMAHNTDICVVVHDGSLSPPVVNEMKSLGVELIEKPWEDDFPSYRNYALELIRKRDSTAWVCGLDADEVLCENFAKDFRQLCEKYEKEGYNAFSPWARDKVDPVGIEYVDRYIPYYQHVETAWSKPLAIFHLNRGVKWFYSGNSPKGSHDQPFHGAWGFWRWMKLPKEYYYIHHKNVPTWWENSTRNFFISGSGINAGIDNPKWPELRKITDYLGISTWEAFREYLKQGKIAMQLADFIQSLRQDNTYVEAHKPSDEHVETFMYYYMWLHPEEWKSIGEPQPRKLRRTLEPVEIERLQAEQPSLKVGEVIEI